MVGHENTIEKVIFDNPEAKNASMKALISPEEGWEGNVMRVVELAEGGHSPKHIHSWPHINYMLEGEGILFIEGKEHPVKKGSYAYVPEGKKHQFKNTGKGVFKFICIVPEEGHN